MTPAVLGVALIALIVVAPLSAVQTGPTNLSASVAGNAVTLTWTAPPGGAIRYRVEAGTAPGLSNAANTLVGATPALSVAGVPPGTYYVRVRAQTSAGESSPSNEVSVRVGASQALGCTALPSAPANLNAAVSGSLVTLSWSPSAGCGAMSYVVYVGSAPGRSDLAIVNVGTVSTLSASAPAGTYYVQVVAVSAQGSAASSTATVMVGHSTPPPSTTGASGRLRVITWNIHHGKSKAGAYNLVAQAQFIAAQNADVVALQEVQTWDENQPARLEQLLEQLTGVPWTRQWAPVVDTAHTEGNVVLTRLPVVSASSRQMHATGDWTALYSNRSAASLTVSVGGVNVHVFSTHLDYYNTSHRTAQLLDLMAWTQQFGARRIVAGDFNSSPGQYWITTMLGDYTDTWQDVTGSSAGGATINGVRFDYLFRTRHGGGVTPTHVAVVPTALSDHALVVADYVVGR